MIIITITWLPRILAFAFICFLTLFSLDVFDNSDMWYNILLGFIIHNIPGIMLLIATLRSFKRPLLGAISFTTSGVLYAIFMVMDAGRDGLLAIITLSTPAIVIGILFVFQIFYRKNTI